LVGCPYQKSHLDGKSLKMAISAAKLPDHESCLNLGLNHAAIVLPDSSKYAGRDFSVTPSACGAHRGKARVCVQFRKYFRDVIVNGLEADRELICNCLGS